jgi:hypothetical protein
MGSITRGLSNNITTGGVILPAGITNASVADVTSFSGVTGGGTLILLSTQTASNSATISFTSGLDSTYDEYTFKFIDIHPRTNDVLFTFNGSTDSGSNYNVTKTTTFFATYHNESDVNTDLSYGSSYDLAQSTSFQNITREIGSGADESAVGSLTLFNPSSTTYVKHFINVGQIYQTGGTTFNNYMAGYCNTTSAVNAIQFKMSSGNFDGIIKLYGVKKS